MEIEHYLNIFQNAANSLEHEAIKSKNLEVAVGLYLDSVFLKVYKLSWTNDQNTPLTSESRIFFSIWVNDLTLAKQQIFYNIHALKLRKLVGYRIESRKFATLFRSYFIEFQHLYPNVSTDFGPLTLMEGWVKFNHDYLQLEVINLAKTFLETFHLIDKTLLSFK